MQSIKCPFDIVDSIVKMRGKPHGSPSEREMNTGSGKRLMDLTVLVLVLMGEEHQGRAPRGRDRSGLVMVYDLRSMPLTKCVTNS